MTRNRRPHQHLLAAGLLWLITTSVLASGSNFWRGWFQPSKPTANHASKAVTSNTGTPTFSSDAAVNRLIRDYQVPITKQAAPSASQHPAKASAASEEPATSGIQAPSTTAPPHRRDATPPSTSTIQTPTSGFLPPSKPRSQTKQQTKRSTSGDGPFVAWH